MGDRTSNPGISGAVDGDVITPTTVNNARPTTAIPANDVGDTVGLNEDCPIYREDAFAQEDSAAVLLDSYQFSSARDAEGEEGDTTVGGGAGVWFAW